MIGNREWGIGNRQRRKNVSLGAGALAIWASAVATGCAPSPGNQTPALLSTQGERKPNEWPVYGGDAGGLKYSPLTTIDRSNVGKLAVAWTWKTGEQPIAADGSTLAARPGQFQ